MSGSSNNIDKLGQKLLAAVAFTLPLQIFALPVGGKDIEAAHLLSLVLILLAGLLLVWKGSCQRLAAAEKGILLCFGVACLSLLAAQVNYGWPAQLAKGLQQIVGLAFMTLVFLTVRRYGSTPEAFRHIIAWLWRGLMLLAIFGLWQCLAFNIFKVSFLADWSWANQASSSIGGWHFGSYMGPVVRVNSFAAEPALYCQFLLMGIGLAVIRLVPPPWAGQIAGKAWKTYLPSKGIAITILLAYLLSLSLLGLIGLFILAISYLILIQRAKRILLFILICIIIVPSLDLLTGGALLTKFGSIALISPATEKEIFSEQISSMILASHLLVALAAFMQGPFLGCGLGGHATAFGLYAPAWATNNELLSQLNIYDAASLGLRLISEMGIVGLVVFLGTFLVILWQAWGAVRRTPISASNCQILPLCMGLLIGTIAEVMLYLIRQGNLVSISFWFLLAMASAIPEVLKPIPQEDQ